MKLIALIFVLVIQFVSAEVEDFERITVDECVNNDLGCYVRNVKTNDYLKLSGDKFSREAYAQEGNWGLNLFNIKYDGKSRQDIAFQARTITYKDYLEKGEDGYRPGGTFDKDATFRFLLDAASGDLLFLDKNTAYLCVADTHGKYRRLVPIKGHMREECWWYLTICC